MDIREIPAPRRDDALVDELLGVWERSVRATHLFLTEPDVLAIREEVPAALRGVERLAVAFEDETPDARALAFLGVQDSHIEMLFCDAALRGKGIGGALLALATGEWGARTLDVNEQNPRAVGFYLAKGFTVAGRSELDDAGRPFPLLHLAFQPKA